MYERNETFFLHTDDDVAVSEKITEEIAAMIDREEKDDTPSRKSMLLNEQSFAQGYRESRVC